MNSPQSVILIVDDTPENLRVLGEFLEADGHGVRVATNGESALEIVRTSPVDLILLDIMMPGMDGYEVCKRLQKDKKAKAIPVIFLTALDAFEDEAKGLKLGAVDYITKPFKLELVRSRVVNHLALHRVRQELKYKNEKLEEIVAERTRELAEAHRRLLTIDSAKYDFLQLIYQKLWAPEKGIISLSQEVVSQLDSSVQRNVNLRKRYDESQSQLFETINNALLLAGTHEGNDQADTHPVLLEVVLTDVMAKLAKTAQVKNISFKTDLKKGTVVAGDLDLIFQALTTVLHAAIILVQNGGIIGISLEDAELSVHLGITFNADIPADEDIPSLFDQTSRFHGSAVGRELGLAIPLSAKIVLALGGEIFVEKRAGKKYAIQLGLKKFVRKKGVRIELAK